MSNRLNDTLDETVGTAKDVMESAKEGTEQAFKTTREKLMEGLHLVVGLAPVLRGLGDGLLARVGLARRPSPFESIAIFSAGVAVGAGLGVMFAPMRGSELRRTIRDAVQGKTREIVDKASAEADEVEAKAEQLAGKTKDAVKKVERKVENRVVEGAEALETVVKNGADAVKAGADNVKNAAGDARAAITSAAHKASPHEGSSHRPS